MTLKSAGNLPKDALWLYGQHAVVAALANPRRKVLRVLATNDGQEKIKSALHPRHRLEKMDGKALEKLLPPQSPHQGVAALVLPLQPATLDQVLEGDDGVILVLDQVTDPHNVGAILRSAAAFEAKAVVMQDRHSPPESGALAKAASGALERVPMVKVVNISQALEQCKKANYWCAGLDGEAKQTLREAKLNKRSVLVLGAEGAGLRRLVAEHCDLLVKLPISPRMESLNVSNAAAIALYELYAA